MLRRTMVTRLLRAIGLLAVTVGGACGPGDTAGTSDAGSTSDGDATGTYGTDAASTGVGASTDGGDAETGAQCVGPEHGDFQAALCPSFDNEVCFWVTPGNRPPGWGDCAPIKGPVGSGDCGCAPDVYECSEYGESFLTCCCGLKDIG